MARRRSSLDKLDDAADAGHLLLTGAWGVVVGCVVASAAYWIVQSVVGLSLALVAAVIAFPAGFVVGMLAYKFRWLLRSMFD